MTVPKTFVTTTIAAAVLLACAAVLLGAAAEEAQGAFPGKNGRIAFHSFRDVQTDIYAMWPDGTGQRNITSDPAIDGSTPAWSADGKKIAYLADQGRIGFDPDIFVANANGTAPENLTRTIEGEYDPAFSPDGSTIAFGKYDDGSFNEHVWVMNADGTGAKQITSGSENFDSAPAFSPDGSKIVFERRRTGEFPDVWVMEADGLNPRNLTRTPNRNDVTPEWSPDGTQIAFSTGRGGSKANVWVMDADGTDQKNLTPTTFAGETEPAWSPNGRKITYTRHPPQTDVPSEIYVMRASDGLGRTNLTGTPSSGENDPAWQPIPAP